LFLPNDIGNLGGSPKEVEIFANMARAWFLAERVVVERILVIVELVS
jgi:hypothetical protein